MNRFLDIVRGLPPRGRCGGTVALMTAVLVAAQCRADEEAERAKAEGRSNPQGCAYPRGAYDPIAVLQEADFTMAEIAEFGGDAWVTLGGLQDLIAGVRQTATTVSAEAAA